MLNSSFLKQIKQLNLYIIKVYNLLNFIKNKNHVNIDNEFKSFLKRTTNSLNFITTLILFLIKSLHL